MPVSEKPVSSFSRREFLCTSAGILATAVSHNQWMLASFDPLIRKVGFRTYRKDKTAYPVTCVTPGDGFYIHTFYDVCPFSPTQRYLAVNHLPFQDHDPELGETCDVCVIDLQDETIKTVYSTKGWGFQLGANLNWGVTDRYLYTNDVINNQGVCVQIDLETGKRRAYSGPMYHIAPDESCVIGFPLDIINATQRGYGVPETPVARKLKPGAAADEGLWRTDLETGRTTLLLSLADMAEKVPNIEKFSRGTFYFFHSKFNHQNTRIMQVVRCLIPGGGAKGWNPHLFTFKTDGSDIRQAVSHAQWAPGGHHPNWHPDGEHLIMNLKPDGKTLRFCQFRYDGKDFRVLSEKRLGSGHPSITPKGDFLVTDSYPHEPVALENGEVPIRLFSVPGDEEEMICSVFTFGGTSEGTLRCDPHPAWSRDYRKVCFNGAPGGMRQVFIADLARIFTS
jgi:hypothetical protein